MDKKQVDESWKEQVKKEKESSQQSGREEVLPPEPNFNFFITTLAMQATIALGEAPNPMTKSTEQDLIQAKFLIDTLGVLQDKTKGNLTDEESKLLEELLYGLRMSYINKQGAKT